jgi:hypothetical protein
MSSTDAAWFGGHRARDERLGAAPVALTNTALATTCAKSGHLG